MGEENNCLSVTGRIILCILNTIFLIIGLVLLILGILVFAYTPALDILFETATSAFTSTISGEAGGKFEVEFLIDIVKTFAYILIGLGAFFFIIALLGIIGGCCKVKCVLFVYIVMMLLLIVGQIIIMIIVFSQRQVLDSAIKDPLITMVTDYTGFDGKDKSTITLNFLMLTLGCCGVNNYKDFKPISGGGKWKNSYTMAGIPFPLATPAVCCVDTADLPLCAQIPLIHDTALSNSNKGCYDELWNTIDVQSDMIIGICSAIIILQGLLCFFAIYIVYREAKFDQ